MFIKSKLLTVGIGIGAVAVAGALVSFTSGDDDDDKKKKYHIIHQKDGTLTEYDTVLSVSSTYTVQNFLADKGIEDENVEIIEVPSMAENQFMFREDGMEGDPHVMIREFSDNVVIDLDGEEGEHVEINITVDDQGNKVITKKVNGEEVELTEEDLENIEKHKHLREEHMIMREEHKMMRTDMEGAREHRIEIIQDGEEGENIEIMVEVDEKGNKVITKKVNGEEVEMTEEEMKKMESQSHRMHEPGEGQRILIEMDMDEKHDHVVEFITEGEDGDKIEIKVEIDDQGNKIIKKTVNGVEVEMTEEELEKMESHHGQMRGDHHGNRMMFHMDDSDMTDEEKEAMMLKLQEKMSHLNIEMDSLNEHMEMKFEMLYEEFEGEEGEFRVMIKSFDKMDEDMNWEFKDDHCKMKRIHTGDEDFTIVIVSQEGSSIHTETINETERVEAPNSMLTFPNPNNGVFTIQFDQNEKMKTKVEILDAQGKVVFQDKLGKFSGEYKKEVDIKSNGPGMYIINIQQGDKINTNKVIVN